MTLGGATPVGVELIPLAARDEWLRLSELLAEIDTVPCQQSDPEAWWPDAKGSDDLAVRMAVDACTTCDAQAACLAYALAADERFGIWGGMLPAERRAMRRAAA